MRRTEQVLKYSICAIFLLVSLGLVLAYTFYYNLMGWQVDESAYYNKMRYLCWFSYLMWW